MEEVTKLIVPFFYTPKNYGQVSTKLASFAWYETYFITLLLWSDADLFGLPPVPERPHPSFTRLARYDLAGLCWLLQGREVVALTATSAGYHEHQRCDDGVAASTPVAAAYSRKDRGVEW